MYLLGFDLGSSSVKVSLLDAGSNRVVAAAASPRDELAIDAPRPGWAEQDPGVWWKHAQVATRKVMEAAQLPDPQAVKAIGIAYQMHGLVLVDKQQQVLRPSIIWCDGRAVEIGEEAFGALGPGYCLQHYLNSPGNFTASKLKWVKEHEPHIFSRIHKIMLPGDYLAMKLTGQVQTSVSGLSEAILWDYQSGQPAQKLLDYYQLPASLLPEYHPSLSVSGELTASAADELGLPAGIPVGYRAGDQPNNALSLNVLDPGEAAANAGTSGVIYGVTDRKLYDNQSRVNTFVHVNHTPERPRYGVLLCINGTGIQLSWLKNKLLDGGHTYEALNRLAGDIPIGAGGLTVLPFGNGPERVLGNRNPGAQLGHLHFNRHGKGHVIRAVQEGIAFALNYGLQVMKQMGLDIKTIRVGNDNMFQSPVFREAFVNTTGVRLELYNSSGALGAAIGAGLGTGLLKSRQQALENIQRISVLQPQEPMSAPYAEAYGRWQQDLSRVLTSQDAT